MNLLIFSCISRDYLQAPISFEKDTYVSKQIYVLFFKVPSGKRSYTTLTTPKIQIISSDRLGVYDTIQTRVQTKTHARSNELPTMLFNDELDKAV